jgi:putative redox protein
MKHSIELSWLEKMSFEATVDEYRITLDANPEAGGQGKGPRPKPLMMVVLAGCTAMDVVHILNKMHLPVEDLSIRVEAETREDFPKDFLYMHLIYEFKGKDLPLEKLEKAVELSQEKYCGVTATLMKAIKITHEVRLA